MEKTRRFQGYRCWDPNRINVVINREAVSVDRANFLATHTPLDHIRYERPPRSIHDLGEAGLLHELLTNAERDEHAFVVVRGIPGTGKSHLIRWLKERYMASMASQGVNDVVLLIERAQCTLRGSIEQIIRSGVFDDTDMRQQLDRLKDATSQLSSQALADNVLFQLHLAAVSEMESPTIERPSKRIVQNLQAFLLDQTIREYLKRPRGPVDRIMRYLAHGPGAAVSSNEEPGFAAVDLDIPDDVVVALNRQGYQQVKDLAKDLRDFPNRRTDLATYLNRLLNTAIGRLTTLTAEDLKSIFSELRRRLREQGKGLALFIEDITAFTGIDRGLVDVLATQHTGEANREFCRLLSVIGVTDSYYHDSFPTNIKERVTLHLSLNAESSSQASETHESDLLRSETAVADLAGRYLNAMRLSQEELDDWYDSGAAPQRLPNACAQCVFRPPCHAAFGATSPASGEHAQPAPAIGLYPFNTQALSGFYQRLKGVTHTPRSFLNDVLAYLLSSYGDGIEHGAFPPPPNELSAQFTLPTLLQPGQVQTITNQTRSLDEAGRIETLLLFWGDRTADSRAYDGARTVGGLTQGVFDAFDAPFITGELQQTGVDAPPPIPHGGPTPELPTDRGPGIGAPAGGQHEAPAGNGGATIYTLPPPGPTPPKPHDRTTEIFAEDIESWRRGAKLKYYDEFANRLLSLLKTAIVWDSYGITRDQVNESLQKQHLVFEDQAGQIKLATHVRFERSNEMAAVLHALLHLTTDAIDPAAFATTAGYLARLSAWLRAQEPRVVELVQRLIRNNPGYLPTSDALILTAAMIEALCGGLNREHNTPEALLQAILARSRRPPQWSESLQTIQGIRNPAWVEALKTASSAGNDLWRQLLTMLNRPQGRVVDPGDPANEDTAPRRVYFLDVAPALTTLGELMERDWELPPVVQSERVKQVNLPAGSPEKFYDLLRNRFFPALDEAEDYLAERAAELSQYLGDDPPAEALSAITALLRKLQSAQYGYDSALDNQPDRQTVENALTGSQAIAAAPSRLDLVLALSSSEQLIKDLRRTLLYFQKVIKSLHDLNGLLDNQLTRLQEASEATEKAERARLLYSKLERVLTQAFEGLTPASTEVLLTERERRGE